MSTVKQHGSHPRHFIVDMTLFREEACSFFKLKQNFTEYVIEHRVLQFF